MMENLSVQYSSSSPSVSPANSNSKSESSDEFRVISVSASENATPKTRVENEDETARTADNVDGVTTASSTRISETQLKNLERWVKSFNNDKQECPSFTDVVRRNKNFRNPAIFEKMISYCGINEFGTNFEGRKPLDNSEYYKNICDVQELCMKDTE